MKRLSLSTIILGAALIAGCSPEKSTPPPTARPPTATGALTTNLAPHQTALRFEISGMHCDGCANGLTAELRQTPGVITAFVTFSNQLAVVTCDTNRISPAGLVKVVKEAGFEAKRLQP